MLAAAFPWQTGSAQTAAVATAAFFPLKDVRPGMRCVGRTVFSGNRIEEFQAEILGVLDNIGPRQSLIIARLSGGPLDHTGVLQGMSGSPVYIEGKLAGAVAMAFPFAKDPIAGIRPIEDMLKVSATPAPASRTTQRAGISLADRDLTRVFPKPEPALAGDARMTEIATPVSFGGFTRATLDAFAPQLRPLGLEPRQGVTSGGRLEPRMGNPADLKPGSMISVQLMAGDLSVGADGTVTYIDGNRLYAFGHRFLAMGSTAIPFARSEVITLLPAVNASFKLSSAKEWMGAIYQDRDTAVAGELGKLPDMTPVSVSLSHRGSAAESYQMRMIDDPLLSPLLVQMAVYSVIDAAERAVGASAFRVTGQIEFQNAPAPVRIDNMFSADNGAALSASLSAAVPLAYVSQSGFSALNLKKVDLHIEAYDQKKQLAIDDVSAARLEVHPGETASLNIVLTGENGAEITRRAEYRVPIGAPPGPLYFTVADGVTTNFADFQQIIGANPRTPDQLIATVNRLHPNTKAYVRVWRAGMAFNLAGEAFPDPPASLALILAGPQSGGAVAQTRSSNIAELEIDAGDVVVSGSKTLQVEVKE
jgi:SpoIVB peptidase S55